MKHTNKQTTTAKNSTKDALHYKTHRHLQIYSLKRKQQITTTISNVKIY